LGHNALENVLAPTFVEALQHQKVIQVSCGNCHTAAVVTGNLLSGSLLDTTTAQQALLGSSSTG